MYAWEKSFEKQISDIICFSKDFSHAYILIAYNK
jgi:hypothetical protein